MRLSEKQQEFTACIGRLIEHVERLGYGLTFGDAYRDPRLHGDFGVKKAYGASKSCHKVRLAVDFNLFVRGQYIADGSHSAWRELGEFWESTHSLARWGGRFNDANHFSFEHEGAK